MLNSVVDSSQFVARPAICGFVESGHASDFGLQCAGNVYFDDEKKPNPDDSWKEPIKRDAREKQNQ